MKLVKIKLSALTRLGHDAFVDIAKSILAQFENHADVFPAPTITLPILESAVQNLDEKTILAGGDDGSHNLRNARDTQRNTVLTMLFQNSVYVLSIASLKQTLQEQIAIVELAGYEVANETHNPVDLEPVTGLSLKTSGMPGVSTVDVRWKRGKGTAFIIQVAQGDIANPSTAWDDVAVCTKSKYVLTLAPGTWSIRVVAIRASEQSEPCPPVQVVVG